MIEGREERLQLEGLSLSMLRWGNPDDKLVICLHGWLDNANSFAPLAAHLPGVQLLAIELAGHGRSDHRPAGAAYHYLDWAVDVVDVADRLGLSEITLMGHSMGAGIATVIAGTVPQRVARLVLLEGVGPRAISPDDVPGTMEAYLDARRSARAAHRVRRGAKYETAVRARLAYGDPLSPESAELLCRRAVVDAPGGVTFGNDRRLQHLQPRLFTEEIMRAFLRRITCPTMLVTGSEGLGARAGIEPERLATVANLQRVELPGGHHLHMDEPAQVAEHLHPFLLGA